MKNLVNSFLVMNSVFEGKAKFILSYGESNSEVLPLGIYKGSGIELAQGKKCYKTVDEGPETYLLDQAERGFDFEGIKNMYSYLYGVDIDTVGLLKKYPFLKSFDINDKVLFEGPVGIITIPIIKVIEMFSTKNIQENIEVLFEDVDPEEMSLSRVVSVMNGHAIYSVNEKNAPYKLKGSVSSFSLNDAEAFCDDVTGLNFSIIPVADLNDLFEIKTKESNLQKVIELSSKQVAEDSYDELQEQEEKEARYKHTFGVDVYKAHDEEITTYNTNRQNVLRNKQRKNNKKRG